MALVMACRGRMEAATAAGCMVAACTAVDTVAMAGEWGPLSAKREVEEDGICSLACASSFESIAGWERVCFSGLCEIQGCVPVVSMMTEGICWHSGVSFG